MPERFVRRATDVDRATYQMKVEEEAFAAKLRQEEQEMAEMVKMAAAENEKNESTKTVEAEGTKSNLKMKEHE